MKNYIIYLSFLGCLSISVLQISCNASEKVTQSIYEKSGAQLWGENCLRCHNAPAPGDFNDAAWDIIGMHMKTRANTTETETDKIIAFLKGSNN